MNEVKVYPFDQYRLVITQEDKEYRGYIMEIPGIMAVNKDLGKVVEILENAFNVFCKRCVEKGADIPVPRTCCPSLTGGKLVKIMNYVQEDWLSDKPVRWPAGDLYWILLDVFDTLVLEVQERGE